MRRYALMLSLLAVMLTGCGQKGPLYLPQPDEAGETQPAD